MSEPTIAEARERLDVLLGEWAMEAGLPGGPPWPGAGRVTFAWLEGAPLVIMRTHVDLPDAPDSVSVIGCDAANGTYHQLYTDDRDVAHLWDEPSRRCLEAMAKWSTIRAAIYGHILRGRPDNDRTMGTRRRWDDVGNGLRPHVQEDRMKHADQ
jgi:hypothetical protein